LPPATARCSSRSDASSRAGERPRRAAGAPDAAATAAYCGSLRPGDPPDGQQRLRDAFLAYGEACAAPNDHARASLLLFANLLIGMHEQTRLQPEIRTSLDASLDAEGIRAQIVALILPAEWLRARTRISRLTGRPLPRTSPLRPWSRRFSVVYDSCSPICS
jgi:hypothetical protein